MPWTAPSLSVKFGPYFKQDVDDYVKLVNAVRTAFDGAKGEDPLVTRELALKMLAPMFGIENVAAVMKAIDKETEEKTKKALENAKSMTEAMPKPVAPPGGAPKGAAPKPTSAENA